MGFLALIVLFTLYFLPSIVALLRKVPDAGSVIVLNLFLGWTFLGWVISMAMAARSNSTASINVNVSQHPGYGYAGVAYGQGQPAVAGYGGPQVPQLPPRQPEQLPQPLQIPRVQPTHQIPQTQTAHQPPRFPQAPAGQPHPSNGASPSGQAPS
jgi:hypothetical protein